MRRFALTLMAAGTMVIAGAQVASAAVPTHVSIAFNHMTERFHGATMSSNAARDTSITRRKVSAERAEFPLAIVRARPYDAEAGEHRSGAGSDERNAGVKAQAERSEHPEDGSERDPVR